MNFLRKLKSISKSNSSSSVEKLSTYVEERTNAGNEVSKSEKRSAANFKSFHHSPSEGVDLLSDQGAEFREKQTESFDEIVKALRLDNEILTQQKNDLEEKVQEIENHRTAWTINPLQQELQLNELRLKEEIDLLTSQLKHSQEAMQIMKGNYQAKLSTIKAKNNRKRQDASLKIFELKDEVARLTNENQELNTKLQNCHSRKQNDMDRSELNFNPKSEIIIALSSQISEQETEISRLQAIIKEKDGTIAKLKNKTSDDGVVSFHKKDDLVIKKSSVTHNSNRKRQSKKEEQSMMSPYTRELSTLSRDSGAGDLHSTFNSPTSDLNEARQGVTSSCSSPNLDS